MGIFSDNTKRISFTEKSITHARGIISEAERAGADAYKNTERLIAATEENLLELKSAAKEKLTDIADELLTIEEELADIVSTMADMAGRADAKGLAESVGAFQSPYGKYNGNHNYNLASSMLDSNSALFGTPGPEYEKLREKRNRLEDDMRALEERKRETEAALDECLDFLNELNEIKSRLEADGRAALGELSSLDSLAHDAEIYGGNAARAIADLAGINSHAHLLIEVSDPSEFGKAARCLEDSARKIRYAEDGISDSVRRHCALLPKDNIMNASIEAIAEIKRTVSAKVSVLEGKAEGLMRAESALKKYLSLRD